MMLPLARIVDRAAELHAQRLAAVQGPVGLSYGELTARAVRLAGALQARGLRPGDRVALLGRNSFRCLEVNFACAYAGLVLLPLNIRLAPRELNTILAQTETRLLFQALPFEPQGIPAIVWDDAEPPGADNAYEQLVRSGMPLERAVTGKPDDLAQIFFTSGTTGEPKGACLTQDNLMAATFDAIVTLELNADDVWFHAPPMFHLVDAFAIWAVTLLGGVHVAEHFDPARFVSVVDTHKVTKLSLPPTLLDLVERGLKPGEYDLASLDRINYGGAPMPESIYRRCTVALGCALVQSYGTTETSGTVCQQFPREVAGKPWTNSVGQPLPHIDLRVIGDDGTPLPASEVGELAVGGPRVMQGYWRKPEATAAAVPDGWYRTGDLGRRDAEGHVYMLGRKKEMIITGGENVYPIEVENALLAHPAVAEAAVFGVPNVQWGEEVRAVVFLNDGSRTDAAALIAHCRGLIGGYKVPKDIVFAREPLPKSGPGKIAKAVVRNAYLEGAGTRAGEQEHSS